MSKKRFPGKDFEADFIGSISKSCDITRLKDTAGWSNATNTRFSCANPCDFVIYSHSESIIGSSTYYKLELKSLLKKSLPYANIKPKTKKLTAKENALKFVNGLVESESKGVWAGFVVNFRDVNQTFMVRATAVKIFMENADRESIPLAWFEDNGILIKQTIKRTRWGYDLSWL